MRHPVLFCFGGQVGAGQNKQMGAVDLVTDIGKFPEKQKRMAMN